MTGPYTLRTHTQSRSIGQRLQLFVTSLIALSMALLSPIVPAAMAAGPVTVSITDTLEPKDLTVEPGTTVTWVNNDSDEHRIRSQSGPLDFDSGNLDPGQAFSMSFDVEGTYSYLDERDDENTAYHGTITVSTEAPPPTTPPPGGGGGGSTGDVTVDLIDDTFRPRDITIDPGTTVVWRNIDDRSHTVTARDGSFDSGIYDAGTFTRTFDTPGIYDYLCILHSGMVGTVTVNGSGGTPPPPPPPDPDPDPTPPPEVSGDVAIFDNGYTPTSMSIPVGTTLTFANTGTLPHTVTDRAGRFDSGLMMSGDTYTRTFATAGTYDYYCTIHPEMTATLTVTGADGTAPPPEPPVGDPPSGDPGSVKVGPSDIKIIDNAYRPRTIEVGVGSTLTWVNAGALPHTVTDKAGGFDSGLMVTGDAYRRTFNTVGTFDYYCTIHPEMVATVRVTEAAAKVGSGDAGQDGVVTVGDPDGATSEDIDQTGNEALGVQVDVEVIDLDYDPQELTVATGTTVVWTNVGDLPHTVTAEGMFDSGLMMTGDFFNWTFDDPGTYDYLCTLHPGMVGTLIVEDGADVVASSGSGVEAAGSPPAATETAPRNEMSRFFTFVLVVGLTLTAAIMAVAVGRAVRGLRGRPTS